MTNHVTAVSTACYFHIRTLCYIWNSLSDDVTKMVACSIVGSRLDYCNLLKTEANFAKPQRMQNIFACVVTGRKRNDHITSVEVEDRIINIWHSQILTTSISCDVDTKVKADLWSMIYLHMTSLLGRVRRREKGENLLERHNIRLEQPSTYNETMWFCWNTF